MNEPCREVLTQLEVFLDGECGPSMELVVREHLVECSPCLDRADFQRELRAMIAAKCTDVAPAGLLERVRRALRDQGE